MLMWRKTLQAAAVVFTWTAERTGWGIWPARQAALAALRAVEREMTAINTPINGEANGEESKAR